VSKVTLLEDLLQLINLEFLQEIAYQDGFRNRDKSLCIIVVGSVRSPPRRIVLVVGVAW